ncbi:MAG TPA: hypothetical protein VGP93_12455 [Polyangiaceae bacterium]|jgi:hypothetical protein|nr:hypothetical protein [Polyangiaceae bacterium]
MRTIRPFLCLISILGLAACSRNEAAGTPAAASSSGSALSSASRPKGRDWPLPSGPVLAILAGQGVGPIRIGATVPTIQRLMALPCDVKTPAVCRYIGRAVEFQLKNGVTERIYVQRAGRAAGKDSSGEPREYGFFNGAIPPDLRFGMIPAAIQEHLGPPERVEKLEPLAPNQTAERHYYPGLVVEFDRHANGNLIMGGVLIEKPAGEAAAAASAGKP